MKISEMQYNAALIYAGIELGDAVRASRITEAEANRLMDLLESPASAAPSRADLAADLAAEWRTAFAAAGL